MRGRGSLLSRKCLEHVATGCELRMKHIARVSVLTFALMLQSSVGSGLDSQSDLSSRKSSIFGLPFKDISAEQKKNFDEGFRYFVRIWGEKDGLGPYYNAKSCASCHAEPVISGSGTTDATFAFHSIGNSDREESIFQKFKIISEDDRTIERFPPKGFVRRKAPPLFGLGLLEAVATNAFLEYADAADLNKDGISGRLPNVSGVYGRFGWTGRTGTIDEAVASAFFSELGIERSEMVESSGGIGIGKLEKVAMNSIAEYIRLLKPPPVTSWMTHSEQHGAKVFRDIGCELCHRAELKTGDSEVKSLSDRVFRAYTDLLLHDMGPGNGPLVTEGRATKREIRTPALWGLISTGPPYMHDGRSADIDEAIRAHDGEGRMAASAYSDLGVADQEALISFLKSL